MILVYVGMLIIGFAALIKGADWFVDGSSSLARVFQVPGVIIGLTIVALGTSAPELAVSTAAALAGSNEIALSNVVGSNIFNLLCVLGVCAVIKPLPVDTQISKRDFPISILATIFVLIATCFKTLTGGGLQTMTMDQIAGTVSRGIGLILLVFFLCYIIMLIMKAKQHSGEDQAAGETIPQEPDGLYAAYEHAAELADQAIRTRNSDLLTYATRWMALQQSINEDIPVIPIYSNVYFDFYTRELHDYDISGKTTWGETMAEASMYTAASLEAWETERIEAELSEMEELFDQLEQARIKRLNREAAPQ